MELMNLKTGKTDVCVLALSVLAAHMSLAKLNLLDVALMPIWQFVKSLADFAK